MACRAPLRNVVPVAWRALPEGREFPGVPVRVHLRCHGPRAGIGHGAGAAAWRAQISATARVWEDKPHSAAGELRLTQGQAKAWPVTLEPTLRSRAAYILLPTFVYFLWVVPIWNVVECHLFQILVSFVGCFGQT
jgi:hypothetical protein